MKKEQMKDNETTAFRHCDKCGRPICAGYPYRIDEYQCKKCWDKSDEKQKFLSGTLCLKADSVISKSTIRLRQRTALLTGIIKREDKRNPMADTELAKVLTEKTGDNVDVNVVCRIRNSAGIGNAKERKQQK